MLVWGLGWPGQHPRPEVHKGVFPIFDSQLSTFGTNQIDILADLVPHQPAWCQVYEPFSHHSQWGINSLELIYRNRQGPLPAESVLLCLDFLPLPVPSELLLTLKIVLTPRNSPIHCRFKHMPSWPPGLCVFFFFFLIFKEAYIQGVGKISQRGDGGGRENEPSIC